MAGGGKEVLEVLLKCNASPKVKYTEFGIET